MLLRAQLITFPYYFNAVIIYRKRVKQHPAGPPSQKQTGTRNRDEGNLSLKDTHKAEALGVTYESDLSAGNNEGIKPRSEKDGRKKLNKEDIFSSEEPVETL